MWVRVGTWIKLPRLGSEAFKRLMEAGVKYDREKRLFFIGEEADLSLVSSILLNAAGEEVEFELNCFVCEGPAGCPSCNYQPFCNRKLVSRSCICDKCLAQDDAYRLYVKKARSKLAY
jgi:hypothetical protein